MKAWACLAAITALFAMPAEAPAAPPAAGTYVVHAIDVGTGLSIFVEGADFALLYDAGSRDDHGGGTNNRVLAYLRAIRPDLATIDHLILSHPHQDHHEMMDSVLAAYRVRHVWDSGALNDSCGYRAFLDAVIAEPEIVYHNALPGTGAHQVRFSRAAGCHGRLRPAGPVSVPRGSRIALRSPLTLGAGARMTFLFANGEAPADDLNEATIVVRLDLGARRVLLAGDAEAGGRRAPRIAPTRASIEGQLLDCCAAELRADILVVGHHGSKTSSRIAFLDAIGASQFVISSGPFAYRGVVLPDREVRRELDGRGDLWRTDTDDAACRRNPAKIGRDRRGPGGCHNVRIAIGAAGALTAGYNRISD
jgi:beta-lactamase superfamily II metal-dependent hydrolase